MKTVEQYQQQIGISEMTLDNKLDTLKDFRGSSSKVNVRTAPPLPHVFGVASVCQMLNGHRFKWSFFMIKIYGLGLPVCAIFRWGMKIQIECFSLKLLAFFSWWGSAGVLTSHYPATIAMYTHRSIHTHIQGYTSTKIGQSPDCVLKCNRVSMHFYSGWIWKLRLLSECITHMSIVCPSL